MSDNKPERRGFHIERSLSYSDLLHMVATVVAIFSVLIVTDRRIEANASEIRKLAAVQAENDRRQDELRNLFVQQLSEIKADVKWLVRREDIRHGN
ncbi:hypothetical protein [Gilvimarinus sp. 1_MG-2023]|uniref:hypothetical protein n=1 Tax=Gilvimarinus sp. 1_MG-2023 TaxID=3062638 RepID=UPI0026E28DDC|nr:hypothetical protein [Gilvimarinus sp. 1_MG-2023]MDO6747184.1 hypothetical protein [Gilvimarinus sp. 1_MG-2023]